ncbi:hypothetical protein XENTR_v10010144 [Xenopus tropicalis]|nr:hypothetical protein XENTR_v10010144 [Xenopus tropicalis]
MDMGCAPGVDYVYKASVKEVQYRESYDNYVLTVISVIKAGTDQVGADEERNFISHIKCRKALDLKVGKDYLIWGITGDLWKQPDGYSYIIGKDTWIEWWPNERDCQRRENYDICDVFEDLSDNLLIAGCPN